MANRLSQKGTVCLIEAGPDYGSLANNKWPSEMLDARDIPQTHPWQNTANGFPPERSRIIGGSSAENNTFATWGSPSDYDLWEQYANGWNWQNINPYITRAKEMMKVRHWQEEEKGVFAKAFGNSLVNADYCQWADFNDDPNHHTVDFPPVNRVGHIRFNAAFAYLDPIREKSNFTLIDNAIIDRLTFNSNRAKSVEYIREGKRFNLEAKNFVLTAGAYGTPLILLRSGIGSQKKLKPHSIKVLHEINEVGTGLMDHPSAGITIVPTQELIAETLKSHRAGTLSTCQLIGRTSTRHSNSQAWDTHLIPLAIHLGSEQFLFKVIADIMVTYSRGDVSIAGSDPELAPDIRTAYLSDNEGKDMLCMRESLDMIKEVLVSDSMKFLVKSLTPENLNSINLKNVHSGYHLAGTCRMGKAGESVVDYRGLVHGLENVYITDASIMPDLPKANTHMTTLAIAERLADIW